MTIVILTVLTISLLDRLTKHLFFFYKKCERCFLVTPLKNRGIAFGINWPDKFNIIFYIILTIILIILINLIINEIKIPVARDQIKQMRDLSEKITVFKIKYAISNP